MDESRARRPRHIEGRGERVRLDSWQPRRAGAGMSVVAPRGLDAQAVFEVFDGLRDFVEVGGDQKGLAVAVEGLAEVAEVDMAVAHACPCAEVAGHVFDGRPRVGERLVVSLGHVMGDRPLVVRFGKGRVEGDGFVEVAERVFDVAPLERLAAAAKVVVGGVIAAAEPDGPQGVLGHSMNNGVGVVQRPGDVTDAAAPADPGEGEEGDFFRIAIGAGEQRMDLAIGPSPADDPDQAAKVARFEQRGDRADEVVGIDRVG